MAQCRNEVYETHLNCVGQFVRESSSLSWATVQILIVNNILVRLRCETWSYFLCSFIIRLYIGKEIIQQIKFFVFYVRLA